MPLDWVQGAGQEGSAQSGMPERLGTVEEIARLWGLAEPLAQARSIGRAYEACLASAVEVSRHAKTQAGVAYTDERRIVLNAALLEVGREVDRDATFLHECAHILANVRYGWNCRHGARWRRIMALLGEPPEVSHNLNYISREALAVATWVCIECGEAYHFVRPPRRRIQDCYCTQFPPTIGVLCPKPEDRPRSGRRIPLPRTPPSPTRPLQLDLFGPRQRRAIKR